MSPTRLKIAAVWGMLVFILAAHSGAMAQTVCGLQSPSGKTKHVVHILFENLHLHRDDPNVPSDLEQMPHLLSFLKDYGTLDDNHHSVLTAQTATNTLSVLTGLYGDRMGMPVANSYGYFQSDGSAAFTSAYAYWTATGGDGLPQMLSDSGQTAPAPWAVFTRAGCDVGSFAVANFGIENLPSDAATVFGAASADARDAAADPIRTKAALQGIAIHCARASVLCARASHATVDALPDEAGGYDGFKGLFGNKYVQPIILPAGLVRDLDGDVISDAYGDPGFPGAYGPTATQSLGYAAAFLEAGVPVVYTAIADRFKRTSGDASLRPLGPGEADYVRQLAAYDEAFVKFSARLAAANITPDNTLFVVTSNETDHFVATSAQPAGCDGVNQPCSYATAGEINVYTDRLLALQARDVTRFDMHYDAAPSFYIHNNPSSTDPLTRALAQDLGRLKVHHPIIGEDMPLAAFIADRAEMKLLHLVTASRLRTPTLIMFGAPDFFDMISEGDETCNQPDACAVIEPSFSWNNAYGDLRKASGWLALVGPGVSKQGVRSDVFSDQTDIRPTVLALLGLHDTYQSDGRLLAELLTPDALPPTVQRGSQMFFGLAEVYKDLNAPFGSVGRDSLIATTQALETKADGQYQQFMTSLTAFTQQRDSLALQIKSLLDGATFRNVALDSAKTADLTARARTLVAAAQDFPHQSLGANP